MGVRRATAANKAQSDQSGLEQQQAPGSGRRVELRRAHYVTETLETSEGIIKASISKKKKSN